MKNSKNTILVLVVVALFVASGAVIYRGSFAKTDVPAVVVGAAGTNKVVSVMPYGSTLDFSKIIEKSQNSTTFRYEVVDPSFVGLEMSKLIYSPAETTNNGR